MLSKMEQRSAEPAAQSRGRVSSRTGAGNNEAEAETEPNTPTGRSESQSHPALGRRIDEEIARLHREAAEINASVESKRQKMKNEWKNIAESQFNAAVVAMEVAQLQKQLTDEGKSLQGAQKNVSNQEKEMKKVIKQHSKARDRESVVSKQVLEILELATIPKEAFLGDMDQLRAKTEQKRAAIRKEVANCKEQKKVLMLERASAIDKYEHLPFHEVDPELIKDIGDSIDDGMKGMRKRVVDLKLENRALAMKLAN